MLSPPLLSALAFLAASGSVAARTRTEDGCAALATSGFGVKGGNKFYKPSEAAACLKSVPFDPDLRDHVLEVVSKTWDLEIYEFNQLDWPAPLTQKTDVRAELKRMGSQKYGSDYEFNKDLSDTINSLNDGHHSWTSCYSSAFFTFQALPLVSLAKDVSASDTNSTDTAIFIAPDASLIGQLASAGRTYKELFEIDVAELEGKEVVRIDGKDPWEFIDQIVDTETGTYQDRGTRRSAALVSYSSDGATFGTKWNRDTGKGIGTQTFPVRDNITYEVVLSPGQTRTVVVPYLSLPLFQPSTAASFFKEKCLVSVDKGTPVETPARRLLAEPDAVEPRTLFSPRQAPSTTECDPDSLAVNFNVTNSPVDSSAYIGGRWNQFFVLPGTEQGRVGVIYITTFFPAAACRNNYVAEVAKGIQDLKRLGDERVIFDTTDDGGGFIALSAFWQRIVAGPTFKDRLGFEGVYRMADLYTKISKSLADAGQLATDGLVGPATMRDAENRGFASDFQLFAQKGSDLTINGNQMAVTRPVRDAFDVVEAALKELPGDWSKPVWPAEDVLIFSNGGACGSACSLFTNYLNLHLNVSTHLSVARPDEPTEYSSFAAQAFDTDQLYPEIRKANLTSDPSAPPRLQVKASLAFATRGFYAPETTDFLQYTSYPADKTFALTAAMYMDPLKMYAKAAQTKWGGTLPKDIAAQSSSTELKGVLGMSQSTTIKAAIGVGAAGLVGATGLVFFLIRRRSNRAKRGAYTEVAESTAPLGTFEIPQKETGRYA